MSGVENEQEHQATLPEKTLASDSRRQHVITYSKVRPHECLVCHKGFSRADSLKSHICIQAEGKPSREMDWIDFTQEDSELKGFMPKRRENYNVGGTSCEICGVDFRSPCFLREHLRTHTMEKPYICEICGKVFSRLKIVKEHLRVHTGEKPYHCGICSKAYRWKNSLKFHVQVTHKRERPYPCKLCNKSFPDMYRLKLHQIVHTRKLLYSCEVCKRKFHWKGCYLRHVKLHSNRTSPATKRSLRNDQL